jgi:cytochrome c-type biogenesis protein CcmH/NrfF
VTARGPLSVAALLLALALLPGVAAAAEDAAESPEGWAYDLSNELLSPFCPGVTLAECSSGQAKSLIMWMVVQESAGRSRDEVREELIARYGESIRPTPKVEGFGLSAYLLPVVVFLGGGVLIAVFLSRQGGSGSPPAAGGGGAPDPELERIVDEEILR